MQFKRLDGHGLAVSMRSHGWKILAHSSLHLEDEITILANPTIRIQREAQAYACALRRQILKTAVLLISAIASAFDWDPPTE